MIALRGGWSLGLACLLFLGTPAAAQDDDNPEVVKLNLHGVESVNRDELLLSIATEESRCRGLLFWPICLISKSPYWYERSYLDRRELARDVLRIRVFYWKRGFRSADVDTLVLPRGNNQVEVTFDITEGPPTIVSSIEVTQTNQALTEREIARRMALREGSPLNLIRLDTTRIRLEQRLWEKGHADALVDTSIVVSPDERSASVVLAVDPRWIATVDTIHVHDNERITEGTIRRSLTFSEGEVFSRREMLRSQRNLYESNLFRRAVVELSIEEMGGLDSAKIVDVTVAEAPLREARVSAGFNTVDFIQTEGRYTHYNFGGGARRLTASLAVGNLLAEQLNDRFIFHDVFTVPTADRARYLTPTYNASVEARQPWFLSPRNELALSVFSHRRSAPGIYVDRGYGSSATFTRELMLRGPASANYRFEITTVDAGDVYFCVSYGVCDRTTLDALRGRQRLSPLALTASLDRTDDPLSPRTGIRLRGEAEHASKATASDYRYNRATAEAAGFLPVRRQGVLAGRLRAGWVEPLASTGTVTVGERSREVLHPRKRFFAGGAQSVRGFRENQLGPRVLTISADRLRGAFDVVNGDTLFACPPEIPIPECDPNLAPFGDRDFEPRPLGGSNVYEASVELRFPLASQLTGAVFVDGGYVSQSIERTLPRRKAAVTPGFGVRYRSAIGPIRVDFGVHPGRSETLPVISETIVEGERRLVRLEAARRHVTVRSGFAGILDRVRLHLSIGEAF